MGRFWLALSGLLATVSCIALDRTGWTVTTDSAQPKYLAPLMFDNNANTFFHSAFKPVVATLPHNITIDMKNTYFINGLTYLPRQDNTISGNIGKHTIELSVDGLIWKTAASGTYAADSTLKQSNFATTSARYVRINALSDAMGKNRQYTNVAEINILTDTNRNSNPTLPRKNWVVKADSEQLKPQAQPASAATDGPETTYWNTATGKDNVLPHCFTIDLGLPNIVSGLTYLPRPLSSGANGRIGEFRVESSDAGQVWDVVASGTWLDNEKLKRVEFPVKSARYFRLVAVTEAGNRGPWTSAAEINLLDGSGQVPDFKLTADSFQATNPPSMATDRDPVTFWHTTFKPKPNQKYYHWFQVDMQTVFGVTALTYTPRQGMLF